MKIKQRVKMGANYWKALGAVYRAIWAIAKKRPRALIRATPEEDARYRKMKAIIQERYGLSSGEAKKVMDEAKRQLKGDIKQMK